MSVALRCKQAVGRYGRRALTAKTIENLRPDPTRHLEIPEPGLLDLYVVIQPSGAKSSALRYRYAGKSKKLTLGRWPRVGPTDASKAASEALLAVEHGADPAAEK